MVIFNSLTKLFFSLIVKILSFTPLFYMLLGVFLITVSVDIFCYIIWGRY